MSAYVIPEGTACTVASHQPISTDVQTGFVVIPSVEMELPTMYVESTAAAGGEKEIPTAKPLF